MLSEQQLAEIYAQETADHATNSEGSASDAKRAIQERDYEGAKCRLQDAIKQADSAKLYAEMCVAKIEKLWQQDLARLS